jgi:hypothetical protein
MSGQRLGPSAEARPLGAGDEANGRVAYEFAVLRAVPHPHLEWWIPVGVVVHARTIGYLGARTVDDAQLIRRRVPDVDPDTLQKYLRSWVSVAEGQEEAGPIALLPTSERFHWLTCPRSDVLQCSPVRAGVSGDPAAALAEVWREHVESWHAGA